MSLPRLSEPRREIHHPLEPLPEGLGAGLAIALAGKEAAEPGYPPPPPR
jgi:hypothetical protein